MKIRFNWLDEGNMGFLIENWSTRVGGGILENFGELGV